VIDVLVVGGGPVGLATALLANRAGLDAMVLEPRSAPIDKACGEGLMPGGVAALRALGVDPHGRQIRGIRYLRGATAATADFPAGPGRGVRRTELHRALFHAVAAAGIELRAAKVHEIHQDEDGVTAAGLRARWLVGADGLHSTVRAAVLGTQVPRPAHRRWGLRAHVQTEPWTDYVEVHWSDAAEAYVTPVADDLVGVAVLSARRAPFTELLATFPLLGARLAGAPTGPVLGAGPLRQTVRRRVAGRVLLVGDAAGYVDALTGEGLAVGLRCAGALVESLRRGTPSDYERDYLRITRAHRVITGGLVTAARAQPVRRAIVPAAAAAPPVFRTVVAALAR
jgi:flavin-dependent dehydrogenase